MKIGDVAPVDGLASEVWGMRGRCRFAMTRDLLKEWQGKSAICELSMTIMRGNGHFLILPIELSGRVGYGCLRYHRRVDSSAGP
ncbi:hypothetical protein DA11_19185 [Aeromonas caviae]|nr:hypothetical protein DA11_19185 [Aeromonas caviae]POV89137.1 hypothetical protein C3418_16095 [Aeromonas sp. ASNIH8]RCE16265.1 hypothetical protein C6B42_15820 [Aeromonas caviae]